MADLSYKGLYSFSYVFCARICLLGVSQQKSIEYIHCFHDVNEMVHIINTIINIPLILYHVFYR